VRSHEAEKNIGVGGLPIGKETGGVPVRQGVGLPIGKFKNGNRLCGIVFLGPRLSCNTLCLPHIG